MGNTFTPMAGFAQSTYNDQIATALPGQIANASDQWLIDSYVVDPTIGALGLEAGLAYVATPIPATLRIGNREGLNMHYASLPVAATTAEQIAGITVRNQQMDSNSVGHACWFANRMCNGMRADRVGGRIWVQLTSGATTMNGAVYVIKSDTTGHGKPIGSFAGAEITGDTIVMTGAKFKGVFTATTEATIALVEIGLEA